MANGRLNRLSEEERQITETVTGPAQREAQRRREAREPNLQELTPEELKVLVPVAEAILSNSRTDAEANNLFVSARSRLQRNPSTKSIRLPSNISRDGLKDFVSAAKASGVESPGAISALRQGPVGSPPSATPAPSGGGVVQDDNITAIPDLDVPGSEPAKDPERERRVIRRQLNLLNKFGGDNKKRSELLLRLGELEEDLGVETELAGLPTSDGPESLAPVEDKAATAERAERGKLRAKRDSSTLSALKQESVEIDALRDAADLFRKGIRKFPQTGILNKLAEGLPPIGGVDIDRPLTALADSLLLSKNQRSGLDLMKQSGNAIAISFKKQLPGVLSDSDIELLKTLAPSVNKEFQSNTLGLRLIDAAVFMSDLKNEFFEAHRAQKGGLTTDKQSAEQIFRDFKNSTNFAKEAEKGLGANPLAIDKKGLKRRLFDAAGLK